MQILTAMQFMQSEEWSSFFKGTNYNFYTIIKCGLFYNKYTCTEYSLLEQIKLEFI